MKTTETQNDFTQPLQGIRSKKVKEGLHYNIVKDGHGYGHYLANFDNEKICPRVGHIQVEVIKKNKRAGTRKIIKTVLDKRTGIKYGIPTGIDPDTKNIMWLPIELQDITHFDLSDPMDARKWAVVRMSHNLQGSPNQIGTAEFKTIDKQKDAEVFATTYDSKLHAMTLAKNLTGKQCREMAYLLGIDPDVLSPEIVRAEVLKIASQEPINTRGRERKGYTNFLEAYEDGNRDILVLLRRCMSLAVVTLDPMDGYKFGKVFMGTNENAVMEFLKTNAPMTMQLQHEITRIDEQKHSYDLEEDNESQSEEDEELESKKSTEDNSEKDQIIAQQWEMINQLKSTVSDLKGQVNEIVMGNGQAIKKEQTQIADKETLSVPKQDTVIIDEELKRLRDLGKDAKINGYAILGKDALKQKLKEKGIE